MSRYCLDTSAYSHFQRGDEEVVEILDRAEWVAIPAITSRPQVVPCRSKSKSPAIILFECDTP